MDIAKHIRTIPGFPKPGINFIDVMPILENAAAFRYAVDWLAEKYASSGAAKVCAAEARGFLFAAGLAYKLGWGVVPVRKPGKLPWKTIQESYELEYGSATLHVHEDAVRPGEKVLLIDDLLGTGGTAGAMATLVTRLGGEIVGFGFIIELDFLKGRDALAGHRVESLYHVENE